LKFVFYAFSIIGSYTPESQNTSSYKFTDTYFQSEGVDLNPMALL
jgi:hypothetical protein